VSVVVSGVNDVASNINQALCGGMYQSFTSTAGGGGGGGGGAFSSFGGGEGLVKPKRGYGKAINDVPEAWMELTTMYAYGRPPTTTGNNVVGGGGIYINAEVVWCRLKRIEGRVEIA
jgi:hypothetical protein